MTLDERLDNIAELMAGARACNWALGDEAAEAVRDHGRGVIPTIASIAGCKAERIEQLIRVAVTFPADLRHPDTDWSVYRAVMGKAKKLNRSPLELLAEAEAQEMSAAQVAAIGRERQAVSGWSGTCQTCGTHYKITVKGLAGTPITCPVCRALERENVNLGVLE